MTENPTNHSLPDDFFNPGMYDDPVQQVLVEKTVEAIQHEPYSTISPDTIVAEAISKLAGLHVACLLVEEDGKLVGVFSDRDVLNKIALEYDDVKGRPVSEVMTTDPVYVYSSDPSAAALSVMAVSGYRHVPILALDDQIAGIASPQRVTAFLRQFFETE